MDVLMTGAYGIVGSAIRDHLADSNEYNFTYLSRSQRDDPAAFVADVTDYDDIRSAFQGQDAVIDLALPPGLSSDDRTLNLSSVYLDNIKGPTNVMEAAVDAGVSTYIYGSSNHVVGMYELNNAPEIYEIDHEIMIDHTAPVKPDSMYGVAKAHGETLARFCAECHDLSAYCLRLGSVRWSENDHPYSDAERGGRPDTDETQLNRNSEEYQLRVGRMKGLWLSRSDCAHLFDCCLQDEAVSYGVFFGVSDNDRRWLSIEHTRTTVGYTPQNNAENWNEPP